MTYEEAQQCLSEMESRFDDGFSSLDRQNLDSMYFALFGKEITNKGCSNCYRDAFIEIRVKLKKTKAMPKKSEYVLKPGAIITFFGEPKCYTNANMTDEAALRFLSQNPRNECLFEKLPVDWKDRINLPHETASNEESEKDALIARLTEENEKLKKENESLKAETPTKKRNKKAKAEPSGETSSLSSSEASSSAEQPADAEGTSESDQEISIEEPNLEE